MDGALETRRLKLNIQNPVKFSGALMSPGCWYITVQIYSKFFFFQQIQNLVNILFCEKKLLGV